MYLKMVIKSRKKKTRQEKSKQNQRREQQQKNHLHKRLRMCQMLLIALLFGVFKSRHLSPYTHERHEQTMESNKNEKVFTKRRTDERVVRSDPG